MAAVCFQKLEVVISGASAVVEIWYADSFRPI